MIKVEVLRVGGAYWGRVASEGILAEGGSPDEALGAAVRELILGGYGAESGESTVLTLDVRLLNNK